jgi:uncharacterized protein
MCTARNYWGLQRYLSNHKLYPLIAAEHIRQSVYQTAKTLTDVTMANYLRRDCTNELQPCPHESCRVDVALRERIQDAVKEFPAAVDEYLIAQMGTNSGKSARAWNVPDHG